MLTVLSVRLGRAWSGKERQGKAWHGIIRRIGTMAIYDCGACGKGFCLECSKRNQCNRCKDFMCDDCELDNDGLCEECCQPNK